VNIHDDFEEFLRLLVEQQVEFVIIGGYAVAFHGYVRSTQDIDIFFRSSDDNARKILRVLRDFGFSVDEAILNDLRDPGSIIRMGIPPVRIEMINTISGLSFNEVWERRIAGNYGNVAVNYISYTDLLINKKASGRLKDLVDFDELGGNRTT
jgi:predicted nucleotidyltransferase